MESITFVLAVLSSLVGQLFTLVIAAGATYFAFWGRNQTYSRHAGWIITLAVFLVLWAIFPNGYHAVFPPETMRYFDGGLAPEAPNYKALFIADLVWTVFGWGIGLWLWSYGRID
ncbi:hypothetical protein [Pseudomonas coronafaciens]|uniref:Uncharacterized protein n=1 Tax=Pseudomonas coronafaciens pv. coronafaciens TaxID=235275 RepID=A0AAE6QKF8_9PSED|nr:hypothetical protein [Pseudomonas coronafaciens]QGT82942.1 hypothetical protein GMO17_18065 [Pseudomonas coronafaciens pv. coronafaciens]